jgi:hypothetical protein
MPPSTVGARESLEKSSPSLPSPIRAHKLAIYLQDYNKDLAAAVLSGFQHGFILPSSKSHQTSIPRNHDSALEHSAKVKQQLELESRLGRIAGPFLDRPFPNFISSPLGLVPKKSPGQFRIIHNLSFPRGDSVNSNIPPGSTSVSYELLDYAISIIQSVGHNCLIAKADIESAFRLLPLHPCSYHLTGFTWDRQYFYDKVLPFGSSTSCRDFELFSTALQWILKVIFNIPHISHILDDFMFFGPPNSNTCQKSLDKFFILAKDLHIPVKTEKTVHPTTSLELHGILVNTEDWSMSLPPDKLSDALEKINTMSRRKKVTLRELQSLIGTLNFATKVVIPGRAFLRRLIDLTVGYLRPNHHISLNKEARADLQAWSIFLK